jgi:hypothetical protein
MHAQPARVTAAPPFRLSGGILTTTYIYLHASVLALLQVNTFFLALGVWKIFCATMYKGSAGSVYRNIQK